MSAKLAKNLLELIGNTPMVKLNCLPDNDSASIYAKLESFNPGGSVKDRIALNMIETAEKDGRLKPGSTIVEPTSGNTGIGLALVASLKKYKLIVTMPEGMSLERQGLLKSLGAEVIITSAERGMADAVEKARELVEKNENYFMPQQFTNPANPDIHRKTTALEILETMGNKKIHAFVAGVGTGGTITGVGEVLKKKDPTVKIIAVEPARSAVLSGASPGPHRIQGIGAGFIPQILNTKIIDEIIKVEDEDAYKFARNLAKEEGLIVGISSGANTYAALKVAKKLGKGKNVVVILPDTGERYPSLERFFE